MSSHSSYRSGPNHYSFYPSLASISPPDSGQFYGSPKEMGPPPLGLPPAQPVEPGIDIDLSSRRTLPSPSTSGSNAWDPVFQPHGIGESTYGSSSTVRTHHQHSIDNYARSSTQNPLGQWYQENDGPWVPKDLTGVSEEKLQTREIGNRHAMSFGTQYRQLNPSETGSVHFGVPHSDSGYGTRRSVGNTSVFSADVTERDQDCQSLAGHVENFQPFHGFTEIGQPRDSRTNEMWPHSDPISSESNSPGLTCPTCHKPVKTQSELKKHDLRHRKPFRCLVPGCPRPDGFSTTNDLDRHTRSKHPSALPDAVPTRKYRCHVQGCKSKEKNWPRLDNFRSHLKRVHGHFLITDEEFDDMIRRAEFWEKPALEIDQDNLFSHRSFQDPSRVGGSISPDSPSNFRRPASDWKRLYPDVLSSPETPLAPMAPTAPMAPKVPQSEKFEIKAAPPHERTNASHSVLVQPLEVFPPPTGVAENKSTLESDLAPAGSTVPAIKMIDHPKESPTSQSNPQGKAPRQNGISAADATLSEVIRTALSEARNAGLANDKTNSHDTKRNSLPNGRTKTGTLRPSDPNATTSRGRRASYINILDSPSPNSAVDEKTVAQVLKTIHEAGYILKRDRSLSPKIQNAGSVASNKSDKQVTCGQCRKFKGRPCELKKHMKRHERPYGCTFLTCNKTFGSKNDWKRHENSQHFQLETWRCDEERPEGGVCAKVFYRKQIFQDHLDKEHQISNDDDKKHKVEVCRIGRNCQARFYCGFCTKLVALKKKGLDAWTERFDHIDDHFMGRHNLPKQGIQDWTPVDSDKPKGDVTSDSPTGKEGQDSGPDLSGSGSSSSTSPNAAGGSGESAADAIILGDRPGSPKRKHSSGDENSRPLKHPRTAVNMETTIYCCQCRLAHNPRFNQNCTDCSNAHVFCSNCRREVTET